MTNSPSSRGEEAREALIQAAIEVFGHEGFAAAGTRAIASRAGANQAMISYYFGGKRGLYEAAVGHIAEQIAGHVGPVAQRVGDALPELESQAPGPGRRRMAFGLIWSMADAMISLLASERSGPWARIILREQQDPSPGFDILYNNIMGRMLHLVSHLVALAEGADQAREQHRLTALTIVGQVLVFRVARAAALRFLSWPEISGRELDAVKDTLRGNLRRLLGVADA